MRSRFQRRHHTFVESAGEAKGGTVPRTYGAVRLLPQAHLGQGIATGLLGLGWSLMRYVPRLWVVIGEWDRVHLGSTHCDDRGRRKSIHIREESRSCQDHGTNR